MTKITLEEHYQMHQYEEKHYVEGERLPVGSVIRTKDNNYYLVGDVAPARPENTIPYWVSAGCGCCSLVTIEPHDIAGYIVLLEIARDE